MGTEDRQFYVDQMNDVIGRIVDVVEPLNREIAALKFEIQKLDKIDSDMSAVKAAIKASTEDMRRLQGGLNSLKADNFELKMDVRDIQDDHRRAANNVADATNRLSFLKSQAI